MEAGMEAAGVLDAFAAASGRAGPRGWMAAEELGHPKAAVRRALLLALAAAAGEEALALEGLLLRLARVRPAKEVALLAEAERRAEEVGGLVRSGESRLAVERAAALREFARAHTASILEAYEKELHGLEAILAAARQRAGEERRAFLAERAEREAVL